MLINEQWEFLQDVSKLIEFIKSKGLKATGGELWRPPETQAVYVAQGKSTTLNSRHLDRLAIDLNIFNGTKLLSKKEDLIEIGTYWEQLNTKNRWGGNFKNFYDAPHFERRIG